jgi:hypothetical protein
MHVPERRRRHLRMILAAHDSRRFCALLRRLSLAAPAPMESVAERGKRERERDRRPSKISSSARRRIPFAIYHLPFAIHPPFTIHIRPARYRG